MSPRPILIFLFFVLALPAGAAAFEPAAVFLAAALDAALVFLACVDLLASPRTSRLSLERGHNDVLGVGVENRVVLRVRNASRITLEVELADEVSLPGRTAGLPARVQVPPAVTREVSYHYVPSRRGTAAFQAVHLRYPTPLGFWYRMERRVLETEARVYPDIRVVRGYDVLGRRNRLQELGIKIWRLRGRGGEFDRLREYRRDDDVRWIDWKATARYQKPIAREYTVERNQNVFFLLDCGRSMANTSDGVSHLDRGLNAVVALSYVALRQGDNVALLAFSDRIERAVGPLRGPQSVRRLIASIYDLEARSAAPDYALACEEVSRRWRKRALVLIVTHALDEEHLAAIGSYVRPLTAHHLFVAAVLRDTALERAAACVPRDTEGAFESAAAASILLRQARAMDALRAQGLLVLDVTPSELAHALVDKYLELKARRLL